jgi:AsmA protein
MKDFLLGSANVTTDVKGSGSSAPAIQKSLTGTVKFQLVNGVIKNFPLLARINEALGLTAGNDKDTKFESFTGTAAIGGGKAKTNDLLLKAGEFTMQGAGVMGFDQSLDFKLQAVVSAAKSQELLAKLGPLSQLRNSQGQIAIPVTVSGTTTAPKYGVAVGSVAKKAVEGELQKGLNKLLQKN